MRKRLAAAALIAIASVGTSDPASAKPRPYNGVCEASEQCLYPFPDFYGSVADLGDLEEDYSRWNFFGPGPYGGYPLNDNSMSIKNRNAYMSTGFCKGSWFRGPCFTLGAGYNRANLGEFNNVLSSHYMPA